ncbi:MAG: transcriptional regulator [Bacteroidetes bacterium B1(2017)]|nr:MAG: transcriptional regulator [Bacteroidetes bacterium B1(2017)]
MELIQIENPIEVFYIEASSFPEGVLEAHQKMHALIPFNAERKSFGISRPEQGKIVYKVAAQELVEGELSQYNLPSFSIAAGTYYGLKIADFRKDISSIQQAFDHILSHAPIHPQGYCIEWYQGMNDVMCMVKSK